MPQLIYDKLNDFGAVTAAGTFPNTIALGDDSLERMTVDLKTPAGPVVSAAGVTLTVQGCDTEGGSYVTIVTSGTISAADLAAGYGLPVPKTAYKFIQAKLAGTFTGTVQAIINSYLGK
jgi:hypothetical protein